MRVSSTLLFLCCLCVSYCSAFAAERTLYDLSYAAKVAKPDRRQTVDLYLPEPSSRQPPLLVFIHGGFWVESDNDRGIGRGIANDLLPHGVAVALLRYRLAPDHKHPAQIEDVAAALAYLVRNAKKHGYDASRLIIAGHSAGAQLAALVALEPRYLAKYALKPDIISNVIGISGIYSLELSGGTSAQRLAIQRTFGDDEAVLAAASPLKQVRAGAPPFTVVAAARDLSGLQNQSRRFADALNAAGVKQVDHLVIPGNDHFSIARLSSRGNPLKSLMLNALGVQPLSDDLASLLAAKRTWARPPYSTAAFWRHTDLIETKRVTKTFMQALAFFYQSMRYELNDWPLERYSAIDLFRFLDTLPGGGDYVVLRNIRDEVQVWHRNEIKDYKPVIVIGLDDEKNLFRLQLFYRMRREYSWIDGPAPPHMVLPLGAFIYFENSPPPALRPQLWHYGITAESISLTTQDPYAALRGLNPELFAVLTERNGCVSCHLVRETGSRSHHVTAIEPKAHGGFALPLETYPPEVIEAFLHRQDEVAARMGATPNRVEGPVREELLTFVAQGRNQKAAD